MLLFLYFSHNFLFLHISIIYNVSNIVFIKTVKGTVKEKWKLIPLALDRDPWKLYLMILSGEIDLQLCQIYTKINIYTILYKSSGFNKIKFSKYATNLKTMISQRKLIVTLVYSNSNFIFVISIFYRFNS